MKPTATVWTYDIHDCTATGYRYDAYPNGRIAATSRSRWQGSRTGERYITETGRIDVTANAETQLVELARESDPTQWRQVKRGWIVR